MAEILKQSDPAALAQEQRVEAAYRVYCRSAAALSKLVLDTYYGDDQAARKDSKYRELAVQKDKDWRLWQREASIHGKMFTGQDR